MKHSTKVIDAESLYRVDTIPPPDGEDVHVRETAIGDWSLAIAEAQRASSSAKETRKVSAFDLATALAHAPAPGAVVTAHVLAESGTRLRSPPPRSSEASITETAVPDVATDVAMFDPEAHSRSTGARRGGTLRIVLDCALGLATIFAAAIASSH